MSTKELSLNNPWNAELNALYQSVKAGHIDQQEAARQIQALRQRIREHASSLETNFTERQLQTERYDYDEPFLADHLVFGDQVLLGVTHASLAMDDFLHQFPNTFAVQLRQLRFIKPVTVLPDNSVEVQIQSKAKGDEFEFAALFREVNSKDWGTAASGYLSPVKFNSSQIDIATLKQGLSPYLNLQSLYPESDAIQLGDSFKIIHELYSNKEQALARVALSEQSKQESHQYSLHPLIINSAFSMLAALSQGQASDTAFLPFGIKQIQFHKTASLATCWLQLRLAKDSGEMVLFDVDIITEAGALVARLNGCSVKRVRAAVNETRDVVTPARPTAPVSSSIPAKVVAGYLEQQIESYLLQKVTEIAAGSVEDIDVESNLMDLGLSSVQLVETGTAVGADTGLELDPTLFFEYPSIAELTQYFSEEHAQSFVGLFKQNDNENSSQETAAELSKPQPQMETPAVSITSTDTSSDSVANRSKGDRKARGGDIAIIGMHGVFPGAEDPEALWEHLRDETDLIREIPSDHWDYRPWFNPDPDAGDFTYSKWGSFIENVDCFDAGFFRISPREAQYMDPQVRLFLQSLYASAEDAGVVNHLRGTNTGVFAGICFNDYSDKMVEMGLSIDPYTGTGVGAVAANRASFWFDFTGPSFVIDTACSSSLFALHSAVLALRNGECDMAFAGGANLLLSSLHYRYFCAIRALSPTGRCHSFDAAADGYVPGECVASLLLKPLEDAERDGDRIHAVIKGSAALHGGYTSSITAPSVSGEENVILKAWENAGIDPASLSYIEAHGTGTKLGDPIEISSLNKAFRRFTQEQNFCAVGSIKANLGHTEGAAGIAGVFKVILQMKHRQIAALAHLKEINPYLKLDHSPVYINRGLKPWETKGYPRRAGISSFGFSGAYAHLVMEEYITPEPPPDDTMEPVAILLSARNEERLMEVVQRLSDHLQKDDSTRLVDIAYTLQIGREPMTERLGFVAASIDELKNTLRKLLDGQDVTGVVRGRVKRGGKGGGKGASALHLDEDMAPTIQSWIQKRKLPQLLNLWIQGAELDWPALYTARAPRRIGLPSYPFAKERHWLEAPEHPNSPAPVQAVTLVHEQLHPLVHSNASTLEHQLYRSQFTGQEFFFKDHQVAGRKVLPGVAYLEMARYAMVQAAGIQPLADERIRLEHVIWAKPMTLDSDSLQVEVEVFAEAQGLSFEIRSCGSDEVAEAIVHSRGSAVIETAQELAPLALTELRQRIQQQPHTAAQYYAAYRSAGIAYGPGHQGLQEVFVGDGEVLARLALPEPVLPKPVSGQDYVLHPALLDSAIQACAGMALSSGAGSSIPLSLPFALEGLDIIGPCASNTWVWIRPSEQQSNNDKLQKLDLDLCDEQGRIYARLRGFSSRVFEQEQASPAQVQLCHPAWQALSTSEQTTKAFNERHLLLVGVDDAELFDAELKVTARKRLTSTQETPDGRYQDFALQLFQYVKALLERKPKDEILLQVCIPIRGEPGLRGLSALLKTARAENPQLLGQLIELDDSRYLKKALKAASQHPHRAELRYALDTLQAVQWQNSAPKAVAALPWKENGVYLITGGAGGLGRLFTQEIATRLATAVIILAGRSAWDQQIQQQIQALSQQGVRVHYRQVDLTDAEQTSALIEFIAEEYGTLNGILHAAGVLSDEFIIRKSNESFAQVLRPKVAGTLNLDRATESMAMDFMVLFSSGVAVTGNPGQVDYAAANGFLDAYAQYRSERLGRRTLSVNWPLWAHGGMSIDAAVELSMRQAGMAALETQAGMRALDQALMLDQTQVLVLSGDAQRLLAQLNSQLAAVENESRPVEIQKGAQAGSQVTAAQATPEASIATEVQSDLTAQAVAYLKALLAEAMKTTPSRIRADEPLEQYGLDSIMVMSLTARLEQDFGALSKTLFFEYQTIEELAAYFKASHAQRLAQLLTADKPKPEVPTEPASSVQEAQAEPVPTSSRIVVPKRTLRKSTATTAPRDETSRALDVAIVGLAGRYPQAADIDEYWRNLRAGKDCISEVPPDRWDWQDYYSETGGPFGVHSSKWGGFMDDVDKFDSLFFNISPREAQFLDPQERLFLQTVWQAMEDAGYSRKDLQSHSPGQMPGRVGVYAGVMYGEYQLLGAEQSVLGNRMAFSSSLASIANRVSYFFDLHGPSLTLDTMCSSSLMALHLACRDLKDGRTDMGIAGGVNVTIHPNKYLMLSAGQFISRRGHCESFGQGGEGYIPGEGVGVALLKRLEDAKRDGDMIYGVIKGGAVNHGGRTHGYSVPNPTAQQGVILEALKESGVDPRNISYVEAHGTGTKLGDPIEITGLTKAYSGFTNDTAYCWVGSAKSNIGHCESAAGIAGLTKVLLQMRAGEIAPSLHSQTLNPHIDFDSTPFVVNQQLRPWERPVVDGKTYPRIAGISSFGAGGSNAHFIIEEHVEEPAAEYASDAPVGIVLSAKNADRLAEMVGRLRDFLHESPNTNLHDLAFTLQVGREAMPERLALIVSSVTELQRALADFQAGQPSADLRLGQVKRDDEELVRLLEDKATDRAITKALESSDLPQLLDFWIKGLDISWRDLYGEITPRRIRLPSYPFARQRCWIKLEAAEARAAKLSVKTSTDTPAISDHSLSSPSAKVTTEQAFLNAPQAKPSGIQLVAAEAMAEFQSHESKLEPLSLQPARQVAAVAGDSQRTAPQLNISSSSEGVYTLGLSGESLNGTDVQTLAQALTSALEQIANDTQAKVCVLQIGDSLINADRTQSDPARTNQSLESWIAQDMPQRLLAFPLPLIAQLQAPDNALAWLMASCCDLLLCQRADRYALHQAAISSEIQELFKKRWGTAILQADTPVSAEQLQSLIPGLAVLSKDSSQSYTQELVQLLASYPRESLRPLKQHLARVFLTQVQSWRLPLSPPNSSLLPANALTQDPFSRLARGSLVAGEGSFTAVPLNASVVSMAARADGVVLIQLQDQEQKNAFSEALVRGLAEAFEQLNASPSYKVVVLSGDERYFSVGGTRESLMDIQQGKAKYSDAPIYELPLRCEIPVIAAMNGHAFGAGWSLGMFCDQVLLAEECLYSTRFMRYGFTPGFGATLIFPHRFGHDLGREILFTAKDYRGSDLRDRGVVMPVAPRSNVLPQALALAGSWARASRQVLQQIKAQAVRPLLAQLDEVVQRELAMHQATFIGNSEALRRIEASFPQSTAAASKDEAVSSNSSHNISQQEAVIRAWLKQSLATELSIPEEQITDSTPFIDIGLDSITGVTWVRNINEHFKLDIDATSLYQFSTLESFVQHVLEQMPAPDVALDDSSAPAMAADPSLQAAHSPTAGDVEILVLAKLRELLAKELQIDQDLVDASAPFIDVGLDSITGVTWVRSIGEHYGLELDATKVYEYPTLKAFNGYVLEQGQLAGIRFGESSATQQKQGVSEPVVVPERIEQAVVETLRDQWIEPEPPAVVNQSQNQTSPAIAIVGMSGQFPQAENLQQFWDNIIAGVDCVTEIPANRWSIDDYFDPEPGKPDKTYCRWMGALDGIDEFDAEFFNISPLEAEWMDPQQRLFLQASWRCIEDAGYAPSSLAASRCGVFVGCTPGDYGEMASDGMEVQKMLGGTSSLLAARISYFLDLQGPCMAIDTACSSSLVAIANACDSLALGHSDQALAGGVYALCGPAMHVMTSQAGMLSADGRCFTFDQRANGFVPGEGVGVLLLKRLQDAERDGDDIYAVIRGWGINQDGKTNGITAPNPDSQARLAKQVYKNFGIDPKRIGLIEAHGTGTKLGDPIEIAGLKTSFADVVSDESFCALGSVKSNIGHTMMAAGVAGTIKAVQSLVQQKLPPTIHCEQVNEHIRLQGSPFYLNTQLKDWEVKDNSKRLAAVSSFGLSGTNSHLVLEEYQRPKPVVIASNQPVLIVLSARNEARLREAAQNLQTYLQAHPKIELADLAFTLQTGRDEMSQRFATVANGIDDLAQRLQAFIDGQALNYHSGFSDEQSLSFDQEAEDRDYLAQLVNKGRLGRLAELWVKGVSLPWNALWEGKTAARIHGLPSYPFARDRYWFSTQGKETSKNESVAILAQKDKVSATTHILAPVWNPIKREEVLVSQPPQGRVLIIGGSQEQSDAIRTIHDDCAELDIDPQGSIDEWASVLSAYESIDHLVWIAQQASTALDSESILTAQSQGLYCLLRVFKALLQLDYGHRPLSWSIVTIQSQFVHGSDPVLATHAAIHGFVGSLAKEYPAWQIRLLDLEQDAVLPAADLSCLPFDPQGNALAFRYGQWFKQDLISVHSLAETASVYRKQGVYVVIGGAGGLGEAWSRWMIEQYQAQVIWLGRRAEDDAIRGQLDALAKLGSRPRYYSVDATDLEALRGVYKDLKQNYPSINGVVHSAVGAFDESLATMDEARLRSIVAVKLDAVVNMAEVFGQEALDFALFFSSVASFGKAGGMSGYSAGSTFEDAFARAWANEQGIRCRVVNWGHWKLGTGNTISSASKTRLGQSGMDSLETDEGMSALQSLLNSDLPQAAVFKASEQHALSNNEQLDLYAPRIASSIQAATQRLAKATPRTEQIDRVAQSIDDGMKESMLEMLGAILSSMNLLDEESELPVSFQRQKHLDRWLKQSRRLLDSKRDWLPLDAQWQYWEAEKSRWHDDPFKRSVAVLAETCMRALPDILRGDKLASDVMFPGSSLALVEGIYQGNPVADFFNEVLADSLVTVIEERLKQAPSEPIRILEIGAGTGGSTSLILPRLAPYKDHIEVYDYTDVSKAFLLHAQERFAPDAPYLSTRLFDVSQPPGSQSMPLDHYDLAIATNVLHATKNIRETLRNVKAVLRCNGVLLLNEMAVSSLYAHMTFGLLEGWWLTEDEEIRIPGAPGLRPDRWRQVLEGEGLRSVFFPAESAHVLGQQIILAESDGLVRQSKPLSIKEVPSSAPTRTAKTQAIHSESLTVDSSRLKEKARVRVGKLLAKALRMPSGQIEPQRPFEAYGIDSILVVQITHELEEVFGLIGSTLFFEVQNLDGLVDHLITNHRETLIDWLGFRDGEVTNAEPSPVTKAPEPSVSTAPTPAVVKAPEASSYGSVYGPAYGLQTDEPIAIIGISGRYPMAPNLDTFWENLKSARDCISEVPADRWSLEGFYNPDPADAALKGQSYCKSAGFIQDWDRFDARFFNILPVEAMNMDPQERLFLQTAWEVLEDGGYTRDLLEQRCASNVGVFAGITKAGYNLFGPGLWQQGESLFPGTSFSSVANRISYFINLRGPSMAIDTMCSSSLTAIHEACENLRRGSCEMAIAGGVNLYVHPSSFVQLCRTQMLSPDERCKSFGDGANGFVPGEGVGAVLLKPLSLAERDGDRIHALIRATGTSHGGKTNGYTVPSPIAQGELIRSTLEKAGIDAREISYIEAHGTGTELGDPIEIAGLSQAFRADTEDKGFCAIGSVKSNMGHLESAAGIAGLTKIVLQLQHGQLAPSLHADTLNPRIPFTDSPFRLQRELSQWPRPRLSSSGASREGSRMAGVSSFGAGGSNVHVIVEEYQRQAPLPEAVPGPFLIPLSAKNLNRLHAAVENLATFIRNHDAKDLDRLAYTLQMGREAMQERVGFIVDDVPQLLQQLDAYLLDPDSPEQAIRGKVESAHKLAAFSDDEYLVQAVNAWIQDKNLHRLLEYWVQGLTVDWRRLYPEPAPLPVTLPFYPFEPRSHRLPSSGDSAAAQTIRTAKPESPQAEEAKRLMLRPVWKAKPVTTQAVEEVKREQA